ncbi:mCG1027442, isoform CRA_b [Mus musculus]|nr:mCG1027442, isoform CRA_b [Mus musculus]
MPLVSWSLEKQSALLHPKPCCSLKTLGDLALWGSPFSGGLTVLSTPGREQRGRLPRAVFL